MEIGQIFDVEGVPHIVTRTENDNVKTAEPLENYIRRTLVVNYNNSAMSINDILKYECNKYIRKMKGVNW